MQYRLDSCAWRAPVLGVCKGAPLLRRLLPGGPQRGAPAFGAGERKAAVLECPCVLAEDLIQEIRYGEPETPSPRRSNAAASNLRSANRDFCRIVLGIAAREGACAMQRWPRGRFREDRHDTHHWP